MKVEEGKAVVLSKKQKLIKLTHSIRTRNLNVDDIIKIFFELTNTANEVETFLKG